MFIFAWPAGLLVWLFYVAVLEKATITLLPDRWHTRFAHTDALTPSLIARASIAIILGAFTHILWDSFTHRGTFVTNAIPALMGPTPGIAWLPLYHFLHALSSVVGIAILAIWARGLHRQPAKSLIRPYEISERTRVAALWLLGVATLLVGVWTGCRTLTPATTDNCSSRPWAGCRGFSLPGAVSQSACGCAPAEPRNSFGYCLSLSESHFQES